VSRPKKRLGASAVLLFLAACTPGSATPTPGGTGTVDVVTHELPMIGRVTTDGVSVRTHPSNDAPPLAGESTANPSPKPAVVLAADTLVEVTLGPIVAEGESWYEVSATDGADPTFAFGWMPGRHLERADDKPPDHPVVVTIHGQGGEASATAEVGAGSPLAVAVAARPAERAQTCDLQIDVIGTTGTTASVLTGPLDGILLHQVTSSEVANLFQADAGTVTLKAVTDCVFAASLTAPR
jgi:hypothetical protein